ncbi:MAG: AAA family ATPase, partial [Propionibacteriaceae bacterium]|nr:AAA family ATPase [Propionibacteriaceae bacterium]
MYLKRLTLRGFKSFASATTLDLEPGITCVVGPNGSGKSNIVDALAWVMGEQGAKTLRGGSMEDVIFAGTSTRKPLGRAEIQLTIDNSDGALPIDYTEVTISRTKFRNGNSEYAINGTSCRLLDVRELLADSGIGREMHTVIGQGDLEEILHATPETRRRIVEEAAGVLKHRERKERALRKLEATEANLNRLTDLIAEIRRQLKPLGRQAEVAKRASVVQADLRDAKARLLADDIAQAHEILVTELADEQKVLNKREQVEAELGKHRQLEDDWRKAMSDQDLAYRRIQETWFLLSGITERVNSILTLAEERVRNAESMPVMTPNPDRDPETLIAQAERILEGESQLVSQITSLQGALEEATARRVDMEAQSAQAEKDFAVQTLASSATRETNARLAGQAASVKARLELASTRLEELKTALALAQEQADQATKALDEFSQPSNQAENRASLVTELEQAQADVKAAAEALELARTHTQELAQLQAGLTARCDALKMAQHTDGSSWISAQDDLAGILGSVASMIAVESGYERAVAAGLGSGTQAIAVRDYSTSINAVQALKRSDHGRAGLLILGSQGIPAPATLRGTKPLMSVITGDTAVLAALAHLMADTYVVDSLDDVRAVLDQRPDVTVVTRDGDCVNSWLMTGGSDSADSAIQIASNLAAAQAELALVTEKITAAQATTQKAQADLQTAASVVEEKTSQLQHRDLAQGEEDRQRAAAEQAVMVAKAHADRLAAQLTGAEQDLAADHSLLTTLNDQVAAAKTTSDGVAPDPKLKEELAQSARTARQTEMEARLALRTMEERVRSLEGQAESLRRMAESETAARSEAERRTAAIRDQAERARL